jgi:predicted dehydrogenase
MSRKTKIRVGVVGAGLAHGGDGRERWAVRAHLPALKALSKDCEVVAVCTTRMETAQEAATKFDVPHAVDDVAKLVAMDEVDVVCVSVRPVLHHQVAMAALAAGKHVFCEHPMGISTEQAEEMLALATANGLRTVVGHQTHHLPASLYMSDLVAQGYVGEPMSFSYTYFTGNYIAPRPSHREWLFQSSMGGHPGYRSGFSLDRVTSVLNSEVAEICAELVLKVPSRPATDRVEPITSNQIDNMMYLLRLENGASGTMHVSWTSWLGTEERLEVYGTEGMLMLTTEHDRGGWGGAGGRGDPHSGQTRVHGGRVDVQDLVRNPVPPERINGGFEPLVIPAGYTRAPGLDPQDPAFGVAQTWAALFDAIRGDGDCRPSFADGVRLHRILDASERSAASGSWASVQRAPVPQ